jgi:chromosome segregation ATPase
VSLVLNKVEKRIEDLLARAGNETTPEEEARTSAVLAARLIRKSNQGDHDLHVIDVKEYDAVWQKELDDLRLKASFGGNQGQVEALQKEVRSLNDLATRANRQIEECQRLADQYSNELRSLKAKPPSVDPGALARVQSQLQAAKQEARAASDIARQARDAEAEARKQIEACSSLVTRLKSESSPELVALQSQVKDLTFKVTTAQAAARACSGLREEERAHYEKQRSKVTPASQDTTYALFAGLLAGSVVTMVGAVILRKITTSTPESTPLPARVTTVPARGRP